LIRVQRTAGGSLLWTTRTKSEQRENFVLAPLVNGV
jgi:hypothetical protein